MPGTDPEADPMTVQLIYAAIYSGSGSMSVFELNIPYNLAGMTIPNMPRASDVTAIIDAQLDANGATVSPGMSAEIFVSSITPVTNGAGSSFVIGLGTMGLQPTTKAIVYILTMTITLDYAENQTTGSLTLDYSAVVNNPVTQNYQFSTPTTLGESSVLTSPPTVTAIAANTNYPAVAAATIPTASTGSSTLKRDTTVTIPVSTTPTPPPSQNYLGIIFTVIFNFGPTMR